jgi:hypothetical protein
MSRRMYSSDWCTDPNCTCVDGHTWQKAGEPPVPQTPPRVYQTPEIDAHNERCQAAAALDLITEYLRADSTWAETRAKLKLLLAD